MITTKENPLTKEIMPFDSQVKRSNDPLPVNNNVIWALISNKGGGKSTLLLNTLSRKSSPWYRIFNNVYFFSPTARRDNKFDKLVEELDIENKFYEDCTSENVKEVMEKLQEFNDDYIRKQEEANEKKKKKKPIEQPNNLIIFDDCLSDLPSSNQGSPINKLFTTSRHLKTSIIITTQKYNKINPLLRNQIDLFSIFNTNSKREYETIVEDLNVEPDKFKRYYDFSTAEPFSFLHVSVFGGKPKFFKKFDEIIEQE